MNCVWKSGAQCLKLLKAIQHTNKMVNVLFDEHGVHIMSMDMSKTSLVKLQIKPGIFETYRCDTPLVIGLYSEILVNVIQKVKKNKLIWSARDNEALIVTFVDNTQKTEFKLRTIQIDDDQLDVPDLDDDVALRVPRDVLQDWMDKLLLTKGDVQFCVTQTQFWAGSESTELGTVGCSEPIGTERVVCEHHRNDVKLTLSNYATKSMIVFSSTGSEECFIGLSNNQPSRIKMSLGPDSYICLYVAPKITDD